MQEKKDTISTEWIDFEDFINAEAGTDEYSIYNRGNDTVLLQQNTSKPSDSNDDGEPLLMDKSTTFKKGTSNLYMRAANNSSVVNVTKLENSSGGGGSITVDQTYDATSTNAQSGTAVAEALATITAFTGATSSVAGSAGLVPAPTTGDVDKYLKGDGTWATVSGGLENTATGTDSLTILGTPTNKDYSINIGKDSRTNNPSSVAIGTNTQADGKFSIAIGFNCAASSNNAIALGGKAYAILERCIQIGEGQNSTTNTLKIGFGKDANNVALNYELLNGTTGKIPNDRINVDANPTQNSTNFVTSGTIYSVLGNINTLLAAI